MDLIAIELSSSMGSVALFKDGSFIHEVTWDVSGRKNQELLTRITTLLDWFEMELPEVDAFAIGRGPGNYSGMRVAITTAQALALPSKKKVVAVSSGMALAKEVTERSNKQTVTVVGDARRRALWAGTFRNRNGVLHQDGDWILIPYQMVPLYGFSTGPLVSSERSRVLPHLGEKAAFLVGMNWYPSAKQVGMIAIQNLAQAKESEPVDPIYMHPAVEPPEKAPIS